MKKRKENKTKNTDYKHYRVCKCLRQSIGMIENKMRIELK